MLKPKYGADSQGRGGIDFYLVLTNLDEQKYHFLIEVKKLRGDYSIDEGWFKKEILSRYTRVDRDGNYHRLLIIHQGNVRHIDSLCIENNIMILPYRHQFTNEYIKYTTKIKWDFGSFIKTLSAILMELAPEDSYPDISIEQQTKYEGVIQDLLMCVSYNVIQQRYHVSRKYIMRLASYIRSFNIPLPDRRRNDWREVWELQD